MGFTPRFGMNNVRLNPDGDSGRGLFARGGRVHDMHHVAHQLQSHGEGDDTILAHINPEEYHYLEKNFGRDTNPHTGLPQFGLLRKLEKMFRPVVKTVLPIAGSVMGGMFGGPMGSVLGGALGGGLSSKHHRLDHALGGSLVGLGHSIVSPMLGNQFGLNPDSFMGKASMMNAPTWGEQLGLSSAAAKVAPAISKAAGKTALKEGIKTVASEGSGLGSFLGNFGIKDAMDAALMATMIGGTLGAKSKSPKEEKSLQQIMAENNSALRNNPENAYRPPERRYRKVHMPPEDYSATTHPEWNYFEEGPAPYKRGGHVKAKKVYGRAIGGYIDGHSGGQTDDVPATIPQGAYVMDATTVSLLGDGNSRHGAVKIKKFEDKFLKSGITKEIHPSRNIKAKISDGEYVLSKHMVTNLGNGDNQKGSKILDKMRKKLREQKGVKTFLPPKSKDIMHYAR